MLKTISLLGVNISRVDPAVAVRQICEWVRKNQRTYVCIAPVSTLVDAQRDPEYRKVVNCAGMVTPDGMPVVWLAKWRGCKDIARTYGPDLMEEVCKHGQSMGLRHFFYGGTKETLMALEKILLFAYPRLQIAGVYAPPFKQGVWQEEKQVIDHINGSQPDIIWVGLGSPKQDFWIHRHRPLLDAPVIVGAGAAFDFCSGPNPKPLDGCGPAAWNGFFGFVVNPAGYGGGI